MGRPINKRYMGPDELGKFKILGQAVLEEGGSLVDVYLVAQKGTTKFLVTDAPENAPVVARLAPLGSNELGDLVVEVRGDGVTGYAKKIAGRRVTTFDGEVFAWSDVFNSFDSIDPENNTVPPVADIGTDAQESEGEDETSGSDAVVPDPEPDPEP